MTTPLTEAAAEMDVHCLIWLQCFFNFILLLLFTHPEWKWFYWVIQRIFSVLSAKCRRNWNKQKTMVDRGVIHESEGVKEQSHLVWMGQEFAGERMKSLSVLHAIFFALKISSSKILHLLKPLLKKLFHMKSGDDRMIWVMTRLQHTLCMKIPQCVV